jgi:hypothetical protein
MKTNQKQAFEVMQVEQVDENTWLIRGLNYESIRIGGKLHVHIDDEPSVLSFEIVEIAAFGKKLQELSNGYACEVVVKGAEGDKLHLVSYLYSA